jgi:hypothetical protein
MTSDGLLPAIQRRAVRTVRIASSLVTGDRVQHPSMQRFIRIAPRRLRRPCTLSPYRAYSTSPVPAENLVTPELERADPKTELELRRDQAPNRTPTWAPSQRPRSEAYDHPRFADAALEMQVCSRFWISLIEATTRRSNKSNC